MPVTQVDVKQIGEEVRAAAEPFTRLIEELHRVIVGQDDLLQKMLIGLLGNGHLLIEGVPGWPRPPQWPAWRRGSARGSSGCSSRPTCSRPT